LSITGGKGYLRVFITGIEGFVGRHLSAELAEAGHEVSGLYYDDSGIGELAEKIPDLRRGDILDRAELSKILNSVSPDVIVHLGAVSFVPAATKTPLMAWNVNLMGTLNILEWIRTENPDTRLLFVSTSEIYGKPKEGDLPYTERTPIRPENMYAATKAAADIAAERYRNLYDLHIATLRPSNHIGPGQSENFVVSSFAKQVAGAVLGLGDGVIRVGNLSASRDFLDVRDVVRAYRFVLEGGVTGIFNVGSGRAVKISDILDKLVEIAGTDIRVETDPERLRPVDVPIVMVSHKKLLAESGWHPEIPLEKTLEDIFRWWKEKLKK